MNLFEVVIFIKQSESVYNIIESQMQVAQQKPAEEPIESREDMIKNKISPDLIKKYRQIFDSYDKQHQGYVQAKDVPGIMKFLDVTVTEQQITDMLGDKAQKSDNPLISAKIDFLDFLVFVIEKQKQMTMKEELMESFRVFDPQRNGFIPLAEMRYYLRTYGIAMSEEEVEQLLKESQPEDGYVKYQKFIQKILGLDQDKR